MVTFRQSYSRIFGIDSVQNPFVSDLRLGDQGNFRAQIGHSTRWTHVYWRLGKDGEDTRRFATASEEEMSEKSDEMTDTNKLRDWVGCVSKMKSRRRNFTFLMFKMT